MFVYTGKKKRNKCMRKQKKKGLCECVYILHMKAVDLCLSMLYVYYICYVTEIL